MSIYDNLSDSQRKELFQSINEHQRANYDRITILVEKGEKEKIKEKARQSGLSTTQYIMACIRKAEASE